MVKLTTKIVKSTDLWSKINLCTKSLKKLFVCTVLDEFILVLILEPNSNILIVFQVNYNSYRWHIRTESKTNEKTTILALLSNYL
jgi:hypothetical protein